jgi:hypothetical protein
MKQLINLILNQSLRDLFKYKSFFLLIFALILVDRLLKSASKSIQSLINLPQTDIWGIQIADYVFNHLLQDTLVRLTDGRTLLIIVLLFLLKQ